MPHSACLLLYLELPHTCHHSESLPALWIEAVARKGATTPAAAAAAAAPATACAALRGALVLAAAKSAAVKACASAGCAWLSEHADNQADDGYLCSFARTGVGTVLGCSGPFFGSTEWV